MAEGINSHYICYESLQTVIEVILHYLLVIPFGNSLRLSHNQKQDSIRPTIDWFMANSLHIIFVCIFRSIERTDTKDSNYTLDRLME